MPMSIYCQNDICINFFPYYWTHKDKYVKLVKLGRLLDNHHCGHNQYLKV